MKKVLTLCIVHQQNRVLLGMKKRGFGMGKWNGFGGKVDGGETIEEATKRELFEEAGITAMDLAAGTSLPLEKLGVLDFSWKDKPEDVLQVHIFKCVHFEGQPTESEEMKPQWFGIKDIPYEKMWAADKYWLPLFLENKKFEGKFIFDENNKVIEYVINES